MQSTTLLDTMSRTTPPAAQATPERALTQREGREFVQLVAGLLPCRSNDPELWFAEQTAQIEQAKAMCRQCPLVQACLAGAVERAEPWGVWGGEVFVDGVVVARKRGRGRPRKDAAA
ncbi:WhiB family transcriptional regulator [Sanguibacter suarezii]|uniref:WhiB family transcriptional regulator n=1 Tax=Sanguibacter suarezii TaxID=60921 RepID=UPI000AAC6E0B|nr:WhiB family transcriptional regulator [Sanguibacter suarezii]